MLLKFYNLKNPFYCFYVLKNSRQRLLFGRFGFECFQRAPDQPQPAQPKPAKMADVEGVTRMFFIAIRNIQAGEELLYEYGETRIGGEGRTHG